MAAVTRCATCLGGREGGKGRAQRDRISSEIPYVPAASLLNRRLLSLPFLHASFRMPSLVRLVTLHPRMHDLFRLTSLSGLHCVSTEIARHHLFKLAIPSTAIIGPGSVHLIDSNLASLVSASICIGLYTRVNIHCLPLFYGGQDCLCPLSPYEPTTILYGPAVSPINSRPSSQ